MQKRLVLVPATIIIFILYFTVFGDRGLLRINHLHRDRDEMQQRLSNLKSENEKLKREISALRSDRRYLESIARRDFGLVRSNEVVYQFPYQETGSPADTAARKQVEQTAGGKPGGKVEQPAHVKRVDQPASAKKQSLPGVAKKDGDPAAAAQKR